MATLGVVALLLGVLLIVVEAHAPTAGLLGGVGALMFAAGIWLLFSAGDTGKLIAIPVTAGAAVAGLGVAAVAGRKVLTSRRAPVRTGMQSLVGADATVRSWSGSQGQVELSGELWRARMQFGYEKDPVPTTGESVVVEGVRGLTLSVRRREPWELPL